MSGPGELTIVLVEDDDVEALTILRSLKKAKILNKVVRATDGVAALELLRGGGKERVNPPYLLLVDIHMPRLDGIALIREIRADPVLTRTVVFVLTTSKDDRDKVAAYDLHVAGYIVKSNTHEELLPMTAMLDYYLLIVESPPVVKTV